MVKNYRDYVGPAKRYHEGGKRRLDQLLRNGLEEQHYFLDIGCGSLRLGRLLIPFLLPDRYCGVEPGEQWVREGLHHEVVEVFGQALVEHKRPRFDYNGQFEFTGFGRTFDVIAAFSVFIHCGREQLATCLANVRAVMTPETILLLDLNIGDASYERGKHSKYAWASHQKIRYTREDAEAMLEQGGYTHEVVDERYSERKDKTRTLFRLRLPRASRALE